MIANPRKATTIQTIVPVVLRVTFSLILWTLGVSISLPAAETKQNRLVYNFAVERAKIEHLQRWVNAGHDPWCRDAQLVAAASLRRVLPESSDVELTSRPLELERYHKDSAVYTFHSIDGSTTVRITLRRYRWLLPVAGSRQQMIWVPERAEILSQNLRVVRRDSASTAAV